MCPLKKIEKTANIMTQKDLGNLWLEVLHGELEALMLLPLSEGLKLDYQHIQLILKDIRNDLTRCARSQWVTKVYVYPAPSLLLTLMKQ